MSSSLQSGAWSVRPSGGLQGRIRVPGDKSVSHRAVMLGSLASGTTTIHHVLESEDCIATRQAFESMGISCECRDTCWVIDGRGGELQEPDTVLDMGNSGTGTRLLLGILAGFSFASTLTGDESLRSRPMKRVTQPLSTMGAQFLGRDGNNKLPLTIRGGDLKAISYNTPVASAQIKSAILLAGLFARGTTTIIEPGPTRDHTERMLRSFGATVQTDNNTIALEGGQSLQGCEIDVPADISSAAFFLVAASIVPGSDLVLESVGMNPTRTGILDVLQEMGADIEITDERISGAEPIADLRVKSAELHGVDVQGDLVVRMIDEFPVFTVAAACATGQSTVSGAEELRVKETDRIAVVADQLRAFGVDIEEKPDGFIMPGGSSLQAATCTSFGDHRVAMSMAVAALVADGTTTIRGTDPVATSFPGFAKIMNQVSEGSIEVME